MVADALMYCVDRCTSQMTESNPSNPEDSWVVVEFEETLRTEMVREDQSQGCIDQLESGKGGVGKGEIWSSGNGGQKHQRRRWPQWS